MADPTVHITNGVPDSGTGNITTLGQTLLDGANVTIGAKADAKSTATDTTSITAMSVWKQISASVQAIATSIAGTLTVATHAVTGSGNFASTVADAANVTLGAKADAKSTATDTTPITAMSVWKQVSASVQAIATALGTGVFTRGAGAADATTLRVTIDSGQVEGSNYETVAAAATDQVMGGSGAAGDFLAEVLIIPATTSPGAVSIKDGGGSAVTIFTGGSSSVSNLVPFSVPLGITCATAWKITTGTNVSAIAVGKFT
jgi:hypothetical protein